MSDVSVVIEEIIDIELGDEVPHIACCVVDRFICGRNYHPEAEATDSDSLDECCRTCAEVLSDMLCPRTRPTHSHCPVPGPLLGSLCPRYRPG